MASGMINNDRGFYAPNNMNSSMTAKELCDFIPTSANLYCWSSYSNGSEPIFPVQKSGYWALRLFHPSGNTHNYDIFEAFYLNDGEYYYYSYRTNKWYKVTSAAV